MNQTHVSFGSIGTAVKSLVKGAKGENKTAFTGYKNNKGLIDNNAKLLSDNTSHKVLSKGLSNRG